MVQQTKVGDFWFPLGVDQASTERKGMYIATQKTARVNGVQFSFLNNGGHRKWYSINQLT